MSELDSTSARIYRILAYGSFGVILLIVIYATISSLTQNLGQVGFNLVNIEIPPPSISPVYIKPITILYVACLIFLYAQLERYKSRIAKLPAAALSLSKFGAFMVAVVFFYEVCYNFVLWSGEIAIAGIQGNLNPDVLVNKFPALKEPWNLVFATKLWTVLFIAGLYTFYFLRTLETKQVQTATPVAS